MMVRARSAPAEVHRVSGGEFEDIGTDLAEGNWGDGIRGITASGPLLGYYVRNRRVADP